MSRSGTIALVGATTNTGEEANVCDDNSSNPGACSNFDSNSNNKNFCKLYMAPTTVGGIEGNYGIFTSVDLTEGATVLSNDGPNIPVVEDHRKFSKIYPDTDHLGLFNNVWWSWSALVSDQMRAEIDPKHSRILQILDLQINFGALPNCHPYRSNLDTLQPSDGIDYDDRRYLGGKDHAENPIRGSFSYYTGKHFLTDIHVEAGTELFLDYASDWEQHGFPRRQDYFAAAALVQKWITKIDAIVKNDKRNRNIHNNDIYKTIDPNEIYPVQKLVDGIAVLLELIDVSIPEGMPLDDIGFKVSGNADEENEVDKGVFHLEELISRVMSLVPKTIEDWKKAFGRSWEIYLDRIKTTLADVQKSRDALEEMTPVGDLTSFLLGLPSVEDVADAMYEISKPPPKSIAELQATGICLDNIVAGHSQAFLELESPNGTRLPNSSNFTIGRGAMASRFLSKGALIVPVPFLHLLDRALFEAFPEGKKGMAELILNYCFGHSDSTMILCPVTNAVLINHCSDRNDRFSCGSGTNQGPNAEYRWASESEWDRKTKKTLTMGLDEMAGTDYLKQHRMLSMEIVATRDIEEGEEIFIDYGEQWEEAWLEHVRNWSKEDDDVEASWTSPLTAFGLNHKDLLEKEEGKNYSDPLFYGDLRDDHAAISDDGRFMAVCWYQDMIDWEDGGLGSRHSFEPVEDEEEDDEEGKSSFNIYWKDLTDEDIFSEYAIDVGQNRSIDFTQLRESDPGAAGHFWPCSIVGRNERVLSDSDEEERYAVRIFPSSYHFYTEGEEEYEDAADHLLLKNYPRSSIRFVTTPYAGDQHHPKAFRHHIEIKDELFPEQWKNKNRIKV